jgi:hypothetical protein
MKAFSQKFAMAITALLLTAGPALAQAGGDRGGAGGGGDRGSGGSTTSAGGGASAGGGGGNIAGGGGGSSSSGGGGGGFGSSPSSSSFSAPSISMGDRGFRTTMPEHRLDYSQSSSPRSHTASSGDQATARPSGGSADSGSSASAQPPSRSGGGDRAVTRSESGNAGQRAESRGVGVASRENAGSRRMNEGTTNNVSGANEVPNWSRPRGDRPATDVAQPRVGPRPPRDSDERNRPYVPAGGGYYPGYPGDYYPNDIYYLFAPGYGMGYSFYDCGYTFSPYGFGYGMPSGYCDPFGGDPYSYGGGYGAYSSRVYGGHDQGSMKLKVKPNKAKVYVDGYYVGFVDEFDGAFQKLTLNGGRHKVELRAEGYETTEFDVLITPEQTVTFEGKMKKVQ